MFLKWASLKDYSCVRLKLIVEQCKNPEMKPIISAFELWDDLQNYGNIFRIFNFHDLFIFIFYFFENFKMSILILWIILGNNLYNTKFIPF